MRTDGRARWTQAIVLLALACTLAGCQAARDIDAAMRRVDVLDRVFEPDRYAQPGTAPAMPPPVPHAAAPGTPPSAPPIRSAPPSAIEAEALPPLASEPAEPMVKDPGPEATAAAQRLPEAPRPDPALRATALLRDNPWLTRFWGELDAGQQGRVRGALARRGMAGPDPAGRWDPMGLDDRVRLVFGEGA